MQTRIISQYDPQCAQIAAQLLQNGELVAIPTETVYGLGGDATNPEAAGKIYAAKGRPSDNPLIIHISEPSEAEKYAYTGGLYYKLAERFMPGPLTLVLKAKETVPMNTRGGLDTVAVRCPENMIARELIGAQAFRLPHRRLIFRAVHLLPLRATSLMI